MAAPTHTREEHSVWLSTFSTQHTLMPATVAALPYPDNTRAAKNTISWDVYVRMPPATLPATVAALPYPHNTGRQEHQGTTGPAQAAVPDCRRLTDCRGAGSTGGRVQGLLGTAPGSDRTSSSSSS